MDTTEKNLQELLNNFNQQLTVVKQQIQDTNYQLSQVKGLEQRVAIYSGQADALQSSIAFINKQLEEYRKTKPVVAPPAGKLPVAPLPPVKDPLNKEQTVGYKANINEVKPKEIKKVIN
jgi:prefoldin subunit 5